MAHPGKIIYAHPPQSDGVRFFYIMYSRRLGTCLLKGALAQDADAVEMEVAPAELLDYLEDPAQGGRWGDGVLRRATKALWQTMQRRGLVEDGGVR